MAAVIEAPDVSLHVPALCDIELAAALRRAVLAGLVRYARAREALADYLDLPLTRHGHQALLPRVLELRQNLSAYDAAYVSLAERLRGSLATADEALARAVQRHTAVPLA